MSKDIELSEYKGVAKFMLRQRFAQKSEQIQEDIITYMDGQNSKMIDDLCQIVVDSLIEKTKC